MSEEASLLLPFETYEENAVNIGTQQKSADMARFIDTVRDDGLYLLDVNMTDSRIRTTAEFLNKFEAPRIMVVSARQYGQRPARKFAEAVGAHSAVGRFIPGSLTNPALRSYVEPDILFVTDPAADQQALKEARRCHWKSWQQELKMTRYLATLLLFAISKKICKISAIFVDFLGSKGYQSVLSCSLIGKTIW